VKTFCFGRDNMGIINIKFVSSFYAFAVLFSESSYLYFESILMIFDQILSYDRRNPSTCLKTSFITHTFALNLNPVI